MNDQILTQLYEAYDSHDFSLDAFEEDLMRIIYVARLLDKYEKNKQTNIRLIINHIIVLRNVFGLAFIEAGEYYIRSEYPGTSVPTLWTTLLCALNLSNQETVLINKSLYEDIKAEIN